jgi:cob(I)alamin adenosyltransferase
MKIYTKTGDTGTTSLLGGTRVLKSELKIESYGTLDELNAWIGVLRDSNSDERTRDTLKEIQDRLFTMGAELASEPEQNKQKLPDLFEKDIERLEHEMDQMNEVLPAMTHFVLPGGHLAVSYAHVARTVCRRAERNIVRLTEHEKVNPLIIRYVNRLSDYLFVLSRWMSKELSAEEVKWVPRK